MNFIHLNTYTYKHILSFPHYTLHKNLLKNNQTSLIISASGNVQEEEIVYINKSRKLPFVISKLVRKIYFEILKKNKKNYFFPEWNLDFITINQIIKELPFKPDYIITYWTKFAFNQKLIYKLSKRYDVPVLCYMMDMAPLTGGCHYAFECTKYSETCGNCPALNSHNKNDLSHKTWIFKKKFIDITNIIFLAPTQTLKEQAHTSSLLKNKKIERFMISVDDNIFKPIDKNIAKRVWNLDLDKKIIFFGAASLNDNRKGIQYLSEALKQVAKNNKINNLNNKIFLIIAGNKLPDFHIPFDYKYLGYLKTEAELAKAYQACDVFLCPSIEDSGPMMINQALMSGRPIVSFDMGVAPDLVHTGKTGYRAELKNSKDLAKGIESILNLKDKEWDLMSRNCRALALKTCASSNQIERLNYLLEKISNV